MSKHSMLIAHEDRKVWADLLRVAAIFGVIVIHACGLTFYKYGNISQSDWLAINLLDSMARCSVPLFVMLSGGGFYWVSTIKF